jgi:hypothetical protein
MNRDEALADAHATAARIHADPHPGLPLVPDRDPELDLARGQELVQELAELGVDLGHPTPQELAELGHSARTHELAQALEQIATERDHNPYPARGRGRPRTRPTIGIRTRPSQRPTMYP